MFTDSKVVDEIVEVVVVVVVAVIVVLTSIALEPSTPEIIEVNIDGLLVFRVVYCKYLNLRHFF